MQPFNFECETSASAATEHFKLGETQYLAGGTTLVDLMKLHVMSPSHLLDVSTLPLKKITEFPDFIEVDALVTNNDMAHHPLIQKNLPFISESLLSGASVQLRNLATTAGNLLQRTRCEYFRDPNSKCNKRVPGSGCDAIQGYHRMHAILGTSEHCVASHASDFAVAMMAAGASIVTEHTEGKRVIPIEDFYVLPDNFPQNETVLKPGELITSVRIPKLDFFRRSRYVKIRDRSSYAFALTSAAVAVELKDLRVEQIRIAMGGIGTIPWRAGSAEFILTGHRLSPQKVMEAAESIVAHAKFGKHNAYKIPLAKQTLIRAMQEVERLS